MKSFSLSSTLSHMAIITLMLFVFIKSEKSFGLEELGVLGRVEPARPYYEQFLIKSKGQINTPVTLMKKQQARIDQWTGKHQYYDSGLTAGSFTPIRITQHGERIVQPMCLIANDEESVNWLRQHQDQLDQIKPVCYLVRTNAASDVITLQQTFSNIVFVAVNPKFIIDAYAIPHYPALISKQGIEQ